MANEDDIKHEAYRIYQAKCRAQIPEGKDNNAQLNYEQAKQKLEVKELTEIWGRE